MFVIDGVVEKVLSFRLAACACISYGWVYGVQFPGFTFSPLVRKGHLGSSSLGDRLIELALSVR